uniref:Uncharacterized protein n=1 Tax=Panagrolaimus sp. JU765 TaxID=591449 RepID=A0AC34QM62_9BILA
MVQMKQNAIIFWKHKNEEIKNQIKTKLKQRRQQHQDRLQNTNAVIRNSDAHTCHTLFASTTKNSAMEKTIVETIRMNKSVNQAALKIPDAKQTNSSVRMANASMPV